MTNQNRQFPNTIDLEKIPNKIYYSISEASEYTGVEAHVLRYWETKFTKLNPKRVSGNQRKYTRNDLELLYEIVRLLYEEGYTLDGAERKLRIGLQALKAERLAEAQETAKFETQTSASQTPASQTSKPQESTTESIPEKQTTSIKNHVLIDIKNDLKDVLHLLS